MLETGYGPVDDGVGAPCVSWVLDERRVVGDNNPDWVAPWVGSAVASVLRGGPARRLAGTPVLARPGSAGRFVGPVGKELGPFGP